MEFYQYDRIPNEYWKLRDWIPMDKIHWPSLSLNLAAIHLLFPQKGNNQEYNFAKQHYLLEKSINMLLNKSIWYFLSSNPAAIYLLEANPSKIDWTNLSENPAAIHLLEANTDKLCWFRLSRNPGAISLLEANPEKIRWDMLSENPAAIYLLKANPDKIHWGYLSSNPAAIHLLEANPRKINWNYLAENPAAIHLLEATLSKHGDKYINWILLSKNTAAIHLLEANLDKRIHWNYLCSNTAAIYLLEANQNGLREIYRDTNSGKSHELVFEINWLHLSSNPAIFTYDYQKIKESRKEINKEVCEYYWHPSRMDKWQWQEDDE